MDDEGHEQHSKQCHEVGGSSSSRAPFACPKKFAKRARPNSLCEESSPKDSPPRGGSTESPKEFECLKIRALESHINRGVVNYNMEDPRNIVTLHDKSYYSSAKERGTDERFCTFFQQDWCHFVLYRKTTPVVKYQWVHIDYMKSRRDMHFNRILEACEFHDITQLLTFCYNWNQEVIVEFYATLFFDKKERIFMWMTNGSRFNIKLS
jgi:hypothetical protein